MLRACCGTRRLIDGVAVRSVGAAGACAPLRFGAGRDATSCRGLVAAPPAERERGRFRSWLCGAAVRFLSQRRHYDRALKRGAGVADLSLDEAGVGEQATMDDQRDFDRDWAVRILELAFERVQSDYRDHPARFLVLREFLPGSALAPRSTEAAVLLGMNENTLRSEVHRLRLRFRECLRAEVVLTTAAPHEVDAEMAWLREVLSAQAVGAKTPD